MVKKNNKKIQETELIKVNYSKSSEPSTISKEVKNRKTYLSLKRYNFKKKREKKNLRQTPIIEIKKDIFLWTTSPEYEEKLAKRIEKNQKQRKRKMNKIEVQQTPIEKKELSTYFSSKKRKITKSKRTIKELKTTTLLDKKLTNKPSNNQVNLDMINQKVFKYRKKKYTKVEDFITYLNEHYLDIEQISKELLNNKNFFSWINKTSGMFNQSLKEFIEIKDKIENKS